MEIPGSPSLSPTLPRRTAPDADKKPASPPPASACNRLGRYLVTGRLGKGGMGVVYEAEDPLLNRKVAIKLLPKDVSANAEALKRFLREAQAAARLNHVNVVAVYDIGEAGGSHYIVMELVTGGNAQEFLRSHGPFHWTEATSILMDVCRGTAAAHKAGLIHRDIKPAKILRSHDRVVKLADFGLVKPAGRQGTVVTSLGSVIGTPHYMSPEQTQSTSVDERSDIYSLGATYFALLTGRPPYTGEDSVQVLFAHCSQPIPDPRSLVADIPEQCAAIIRKAMAKNRAQRYGSVGELMDDLDQILGSAREAAPAGRNAAQPPPFVWSKPSSVEVTQPVSLAEAHPGENTEVIAPPRPRWKRIGIVLIGMLAFAFVVALLVMAWNRPTTTEPPGVKDDWASVSAEADKAIRSRNAVAMKGAIERIKVLQIREANAALDQQAAMRQTLVLLEKTLAFRESITEKGRVLGVDGIVTCLDISPDDNLLAVGQGSGDAGALIYDGRTGEKRATLWPRAKGIIRAQSLSFAHDSSVLAVSCPDTKDVKLWHTADGKESSLALGPNVVRALTVKFSPVSKTLTAGLELIGEGRGKYLKIWDIETGLERSAAFKAEHTGKVWSLAYCTGGQQVASGSQDKRVVLWNAETGRIWRELHTGLTVHAITCGPQGRTMAVAGADKDGSVLQFWDYAGSQLLASKPSTHGPCRCLAFTRNGALLASGSGAQVLLWNPETHELLATLTGHSQPITSLAFFSESGILATGSSDQTVRLWDVSRFLSRPEP